MNINIKSNYDTAEAMNIRLFADKSKNREVDSAKANNESIADETLRHEKEKFRKKYSRQLQWTFLKLKTFSLCLLAQKLKLNLKMIIQEH